jgi:hypothetical protein
LRGVFFCIVIPVKEAILMNMRSWFLACVVAVGLPGSFANATWPRLVEGALSRSVRDTAAFLSATENPKMPFPKLGLVSGKSTRRLKISLIYRVTDTEKLKGVLKKVFGS